MDRWTDGMAEALTDAKKEQDRCLLQSEMCLGQAISCRGLSTELCCSGRCNHLNVGGPTQRKVLLSLLYQKAATTSRAKEECLETNFAIKGKNHDKMLCIRKMNIYNTPREL